MPYSMAPGRRSSLRPLQPLPIIIEDVAEAPVIPQRSPRRLTLNGQEGTPMALDSVLQNREGGVPDRKSETPKEGIMDHEWIAKRGGWCRLVLGSLLLIAAIIGLAVGLTIGLGQRAQSSSPAALPTGVFPAGSYAFTTALTSISTGCTSSTATWRCFPYSTFDPAVPDLSTATYFWIIRPVTSWSYVISSSDNLFAPSFANVSLTLLDGSLHTERFIFSFTMEKTVTANGPLDNTNQLATCLYPRTVMRGTIWTRMRATYPANISETAAPVNASNVFAPWPFAVEVNQETKDVPECRDSGGRAIGGDLRPKTTPGSCRCEYANHNLPAAKGNHTVRRAEMRRRRSHR